MPKLTNFAWQQVRSDFSCEIVLIQFAKLQQRVFIIMYYIILMPLKD